VCVIAAGLPFPVGFLWELVAQIIIEAQRSGEGGDFDLSTIQDLIEFIKKFIEEHWHKEFDKEYPWLAAVQALLNIVCCALRLRDCRNDAIRKSCETEGGETIDWTCAQCKAGPVI
jgi:hypothetical protein